MSRRSILAAVDVAIDGGALTGLPSTVVDVTSLDSNGEWTVLREGGMSMDELRERLRPSLNAVLVD